MGQNVGISYCIYYYIILVYIPGPDFTMAGEQIVDSYSSPVGQTVDPPVFLLGDFNKCNINTNLANLEQYVYSPH